MIKLLTTVANLLTKILGPVIVYFMGKRAEKKEQETEVLKEELKDAKESAKIADNVRSMSDYLLSNSLYRKSDKDK